jgi:hypothetical protein
MTPRVKEILSWFGTDSAGTLPTWTGYRTTTDWRVPGALVICRWIRASSS